MEGGGLLRLRMHELNWVFFWPCLKARALSDVILTIIMQTFRPPLFFRTALCLRMSAYMFMLQCFLVVHMREDQERAWGKRAEPAAFWWPDAAGVLYDMYVYAVFGAGPFCLPMMATAEEADSKLEVRGRRWGGWRATKVTGCNGTSDGRSDAAIWMQSNQPRPSFLFHCLHKAISCRHSLGWSNSGAAVLMHFSYSR